VARTIMSYDRTKHLHSSPVVSAPTCSERTPHAPSAMAVHSVDP
jgi:hypothetical protein